MRTASVVVLCLSLVLQGLYYWVRDAFSKDLPSAFFASDVMLAVALISLAIFRFYPRITVAAVWMLFFTSAVFLQPFAQEHGVSWFLKRNCLVIASVVLVHLAYSSRKDRKSR